MAGSCRPCEPDRVMPLPAGHLARCINDTVDALDLNALDARYDRGGSRIQPFHPAMMIKVVV